MAVQRNESTPDFQQTFKNITGDDLLEFINGDNASRALRAIKQSILAETFSFPGESSA